MDEADLPAFKFGTRSFKRLLEETGNPEFRSIGESMRSVGLILEYATRILSAKRWLRKAAGTWTEEDQRKHRRLVRKGKRLACWAYAQDRIGIWH